MKIIKEDIWKKYVENNTDVYGKAILDFAQKWADNMEKEIDNGRPLDIIADKCQPKSDITGLMYFIAVKVLSLVWEHGRDLLLWHNIKYLGIKEGTRATREDKIVKPMLTIGS
jgi:hypothetical protein